MHLESGDNNRNSPGRVTVKIPWKDLRERTLQTEKYPLSFTRSLAWCPEQQTHSLNADLKSLPKLHADVVHQTVVCVYVCVFILPSVPSFLHSFFSEHLLRQVSASHFHFLPVLAQRRHSINICGIDELIFFKNQLTF